MSLNQLAPMVIINEEGFYDSILDWIRARAYQQQCEEWLNNAINIIGQVDRNGD